MGSKYVFFEILDLRIESSHATQLSRYGKHQHMYLEHFEGLMKGILEMNFKIQVLTE